MTTAEFIGSVTSISLPNVFNPYTDRCPVYDVADAPGHRKKALRALLRAAAESQLDSLWVGRDLGYRGGRRTGLALTDDVHLDMHACRWDVQIERPTKGAPVSERTAAVVWNLLDQIRAPIFLWNVFPLHPHEPNNPFTNRAHTSKERKVGQAILAELISLLRPRRIVAIGNDAATSLRTLCPTSQIIQVRHPSYGGQNEFLSSMRDLYEIKSETEVQPTFWS